MDFVEQVQRFFRYDVISVRADKAVGRVFVKLQYFPEHGNSPRAVAQTVELTGSPERIALRDEILAAA